MVAQDLINLSAKALGALKPGQSLNADELADGLLFLNLLIDSSNTSKANIYCESVAQYPTAANTQSYTIGPGGVWNTTRPQRIVQANMLLPSSPTVRKPLDIWGRKRWGAVRLQQVYTYPAALYCDYNDPLATIYFVPIPDAVYQIELYMWQLNAALASLSTTISVPPGYEEFWQYNLAERIAATLEVEIPAKVTELARQSRANIMRMNLKSPQVRSDYASREPSGFNYFSGEPA